MNRRSARPLLLLAAGAMLVAGMFTMERGLETLGIAVAFKAKMLCSGVFLSERPTEDVVAELEIDDLAPLRFIQTRVDTSEGTVRASALGLVRHEAVSRGATGCTLVPRGMTRWQLRRASVRDDSGLWGRKPSPPLSTAPPDDPVRLALDPVLARAFDEPDSAHLRRTRAVIVMQHGRIVAERYAPGITSDTRLLGWSMTKGVMNALVGILVRDGRLSLDAPVRMPEWSTPGDPRDLLRRKRAAFRSYPSGSMITSPV